MIDFLRGILEWYKVKFQELILRYKSKDEIEDNEEEVYDIVDQPILHKEVECSYCGNPILEYQPKKTFAGSVFHKICFKQAKKDALKGRL